jgi:very-short-patch-repair endonuclease
MADFGLTRKAIEHRVAAGRLHKVHAGVYAVGRPRLTQHGRWAAAVLCCGPDAALSHEDAGRLWQITPVRRSQIQVSVPRGNPRDRPGIVVHRRRTFDVTEHLGIPVTTPVFTVVDLAPRLPPREVEAAINEADKLGLVSPVELRRQLDDMPRIPGLKVVRSLLDRDTFVLTDSELERYFLPIARVAGLAQPETGVWLHGFKVDFHWPELGLVVETDGLRYHRTPAQQAGDRRRDQTLAAAGLTVLRFTHWQVRHEPRHVRATLVAVARRRGSVPRSPS